MGFFAYLKTWFGKKTDEMKDPAIEIEQAIQEAQKRDRELRNQAAMVLANRQRVEQELEESSGDLAEAKELAKQALLKADSAAKAGNAAEAEKWNNAATQIAMKMQAAQNSVDMYTKQLVTATAQAEAAKKAVQQNAMAVQEMAAKRMQMLGQLEAAKMQESVNKAMDAMNAQVGDTGVPSLDAVNDKIQQRMAVASAHAELKAATPDGAIAELKMSTGQLKAESALDDLRAELGLTTAATPIEATIKQEEIVAPAAEIAAPAPEPPPASS
jgi:phage shock protein A